MQVIDEIFFNWLSENPINFVDENILYMIKIWWHNLQFLTEIVSNF